ncbi:hypothetical protein NPIL_127301 [Nephila pilipes]|uniref:Uncharacterized protein n=1 Tax=Nephila pilipes TaxID=299642 RepID=A0A8X6MGM7_NEPPI|nr:hypothetical protein NPIL_127301 [Nephila pilipes]
MSSRLRINYYHPDLHRRRLQAGSLLPFSVATLLIITNQSPADMQSEYADQTIDSNARIVSEFPPGFPLTVLPEHSSTSFGSQHVRSAPPRHGR